jgi:3-(3-hydroxy-phenyl)propionate hydroxylase
METETINAAILIVGAGPTGLTLANILGQSGIDTVVIDRKESTVGEPRAVSIDDESLRTMQAIGIVGEVLKNVVTGYGVHYLTEPGGRCFAKVEPTASEYGYPRRNAFRQPLFEASLREGLARFPSVRIWFGHTLEKFTQDASGVTATIQRADGSTVQVHANYMVGADGGRSPVREMLGVCMSGSTFKSRWLVVDTEHDDDPFWQTRVYCDARRPVVDVPGPHHTRRYEILIHPDEDADQAMQPERVAELLRPFRQGRPTDIIRKVVYTFHARMADKWRSGRVFLAGDAAHLTPPYAGQGLNSGIRDAHNLGWKLAAASIGAISDEALDSYETERRPHAWALIRLALNLGIVMAPRTRFHAWLAQSFFTVTAYIPPIRDYFLQMKFKPKPQYTQGLLGPETTSQQAPGGRGRMFAQPTVRTSDGSEVLLDEIIGHKFALISYGDCPGLKHPLWRALGATRICILPKAGKAGDLSLAAGAGTVVVYDKNDALRNFFAGRQGQLVLVRPDRYIAGCFVAAQEDTFANTFSAALGRSGDDAVAQQRAYDRALGQAHAKVKEGTAT